MTTSAQITWLVLALLAWVGAPAAASAHAHVFILGTVEVVFSGKLVTGLNLRWAFDEVFSDGMFNDFDTNDDRSFDTAEVDGIRTVSVPSMKEFGYFTHVWVNGKQKQDFAKVALNVTNVGDVVIYEWSLTLAEPVDPSRDTVEISIFDDSYYCDVVLNMPKPVKLPSAPDTCSYSISEDETKAYYYDSIYPEVIKLTCPN